MAAAASEEALQRYARPPWLAVVPSGTPAAPGARRSHLPDGRIVVWSPPLDQPYAVDAEDARRDPPATLANATSLSPQEFWRAWTRCEVIAKLLDLPLASWLRWPNLTPPVELTRRVAMVTAELPGEPDLTISCGLITCGLTNGEHI